MTRKKKYVIMIALALLIAALLGAVMMTNTDLYDAVYTVKTELTDSIRIVHLSDLHSWEFGDGNQELVTMVTEQGPDLILMTGDMLDKSDEDAAVACALIKDLAEIAPVYYGYGNHEKAWERENGKSLAPELTAAGATVLDCAYLDLEVKGQPLRLGGYYGYYRRPHMTLDDEAAIERENAFFGAFEDTDRYKILLNHIPTAWLDWGLMDDFPVDLVLTGHYHGGQIRLPLIGGLRAPYVGWFPEYTEGIYYGERATCILSTGLGSSPNIPRVNNPPQIVVVDLIPET